MIFNLDKVTATIFKLRRTALGRQIAKQNKSRDVVAVAQHCYENRAGGMFGLLVSSDSTHHH